MHIDCNPQVEQLKRDNIVNPDPGSEHVSLEKLLSTYDSRPLTSVHEILPKYLA